MTGKKPHRLTHWLPLSRPAPQVSRSRLGSAFQTNWIDMDRGIRVGHLEEDERITWILKQRLKESFGERFLIDRWGRGVYWQYVWFVPEGNWRAKNIGGSGHFASAKYFISVDQDRRVFQAGLFLESGHQKDSDPRFVRTRQWDWPRFTRRLARDTQFRLALSRLIRKDGFELAVGFGEDRVIFDSARFRGPGSILSEIRRRPAGGWTVVSLYYPMLEDELQRTRGPAVVDATMAVFNELLPIMNGCLKVGLEV